MVVGGTKNNPDMELQRSEKDDLTFASLFVANALRKKHMKPLLNSTSP